MGTLGATKTVISPPGSTVVGGQTIKYDITVTNGTTFPTTFAVADSIPVNTSFVSITQTSGTVTTGPGSTHEHIMAPAPGTIDTIIIDSGSDMLAAGGVKVFRLTVRVNQDAPPGSTITNSG